MSGSEAPIERPTDAVTLLRPLIIAGMMTCIIISLGSLVRRVVPQWPGQYLATLAFVICLEGIASERLLRDRAAAARSKAELRAVECVVIVVVLRGVLSLVGGWPQLGRDVSRWLVDPGAIFDAVYLVSALVLIVVRLTAIHLAQDLLSLEVSPAGDPPPPTTSDEFWIWITRPRGTADSIESVARLNRTFQWGGILLLLFAGLTRLDIEHFLQMEHPSTPGIIVNALVYFLLGLALLSQAQYAKLRNRWRFEGIDVTPRLGPRWAVLGLASVALIALLALLLPSNYSTDLLGALQLAVAKILYPIASFVMGIFSVLMWLLGQIQRLISGEDVATEWPRTTPPPMEAPPPAQPGVNWLESFRTLAFWGLLVWIVSYSVYHYLKSRGEFWAKLLRAPLFKWLALLWRKLVRAGRRVAQRAGEGLQVGLRRIWPQRKRPQRTWRFLSLRSLSPRELVRYYYLSTVKRAAQVGWKRRPSQTPYEYQRALEENAPESEADVEALTEAFVEARYDVRELGATNASAAKRAWQRLRTLLRQVRRGRHKPGVQD